MLYALISELRDALIDLLALFCSTEFSTAAFRFGHSTIRQTFGINGVQLDLKRIFDSFITVDRFGKSHCSTRLHFKNW